MEASPVHSMEYVNGTYTPSQVKKLLNLSVTDASASATGFITLF